MPEQPYHKFVFNQAARTFVGKFEEMYQAEDDLGFDSWHQDDLNRLDKKISLAVISQYRYKSILDVGCGKGAFTNVLKDFADRVVGIDLSVTAIKKAQERYPEIDFRVMRADQISHFLSEPFDLVVVLETLSYLENWQEVLEQVSKLGQRVFIQLYLPQNPIGFVKSITLLREVVAGSFDIETMFVQDDERVFLIAKAGNSRK